MIRLNKYLSEAGICSRREADRLIEAGRVTVDGVRAVPGMKVSEEQKNLCREKSDPGCQNRRLFWQSTNRQVSCVPGI